MSRRAGRSRARATVPAGDSRSEAASAAADAAAVGAGAADAADPLRAAALRAMLDDDARRLAGRIAALAGDRQGRAEARAGLAPAFACSADADASASDLLAALERLAPLLRRLGDGAVDAARPLMQLLIRKPFPERIMRPRTATLVLRQAKRMIAAGELPMALSEARIEALARRCEVQAPGLLKPHRQNPGDGEKLAGGEAALLHKRGKSPFS